MKFSVMERMLLLSLLPETGSFTNLKLLRKTREDLSFTEDENRKLHFREEDGQMLWDNTILVSKKTGEQVLGNAEELGKLVETDPKSYEIRYVIDEKEISIGDTVSSLIIKAMKDLDGEESLRNEHMSLCEKFNYE